MFDGVGLPPVVLSGSHDLYIAELDSETGRAFSSSPGHPGEWGYVDIAEMEATVAASC